MEKYKEKALTEQWYQEFEKFDGNIEGEIAKQGSSSLKQW